MSPAALALTALLAAAQQGGGAPAGSGTTNPATPSGGQTGTGQTGGVGTTDTTEQPGAIPSQQQADDARRRSQRRRAIRQPGSQFDRPDQQGTQTVPGTERDRAGPGTTGTGLDAPPPPERLERQ